MSNKIWTTELIETDDGTGDAILQFPDELIAETGWKEGTVLKLAVKDGILYITEKKLESI
jgi:hypothetical protein